MGLPSKIQFVGLAITTASLPWSEFGTSLGMGLLALSWVVALVTKTTIRPKHKLLTVSLLICFGWCALSLLWSENTVEGLSALKILLPVLIIPLSLFCVPLLKNTLKFGIKILIISTFFAAIAGLINGHFLEIGKFSPFISHIRMGLILALCLGLSILEKKRIFSILFGGVAIASVWFTQSITGIGMIAFAIFYSAIALAIPKYKTQTILLALLTVAFGSAWLFKSLMPTPFTGTPEELTPWGNPYIHYPEKHLEENGNKVNMYLAYNEMRPEWNKVSKIPYDSLDANGFPIESTLTRYLTSLGKPKNGAQIQELSSDDIRNIENGHTSIRMSTHSGLNLRIDALRFELGNYLDDGNPNGNSVTMRLEAFKAGRHLISSNGIIVVLFGVGVGDIHDNIKNSYSEIGSRLQSENWKRTHNQYLAWWIGCGLLGLCILFVVLYSSWISTHGALKLAWWIIVLSCLAEDTLETQAGVTFAMLSLCLFTLVPKKRN